MANQQLKDFMIKLLRAADGCLGIDRRRRTRKPAIIFGELERSIDPEDSEWGNPMGVIFHYFLPNSQVKKARPAEVTHLSKQRKINLEEIPIVAASEVGRAQTEGLVSSGLQGLSNTYLRFQSNNLGRLTIQGDSPVDEKIKRRDRYLSRAGHGKSGLNLGGPPSKAKYSSMTDSEPVPRGKGEKNPCQGSEIEPEISSLQTVEGLCSFLRRMADGVPFA